MIASRPADAVMIPEHLKRGSRSYLRINSIMAIAEPLLGVNAERGERGYLRRTLHAVPDPSNPGKMSNLLFITKSPHDTMLYPTGHPRHPHPRYRWEQDGLIRIGYLIDPPEEQLGIYHETPR